MSLCLVEDLAASQSPITSLRLRCCPKKGSSSKSSLDARGRHQVRLLQCCGVHVYEGGSGCARETDGVVATVGLPSDSVHIRCEYCLWRSRPSAAGLDGHSLRSIKSSRREWAGEGSRTHRLVTLCGEYLSRVWHSMFYR